MSGKKYADGSRYDDSDYSEEEKRIAREQRKKRGSPFVRPGETSNFQRRKSTLEKMRDYFRPKKKKK